MGYTGYYAGIRNRNDLRSELERILEWGDGNHCLVDLSISSGAGYAGIKEYFEDHFEVTAYVVRYFVRKDGEFVYKIMHESMFPGYCDCPVRILEKLTPTNNEDANAWREACRKHNAEKSERAKQAKALRDFPENTCIKWTYLPTGVTYTLQKIRTFSGKVLWITEDWKFKVSPTKILNGKWEVL